jgi:FAD/FMN-containing dehydrogenase
VVFARTLSTDASVMTPTSDGYDGFYGRMFSTSIAGLEFPMIIVRAAEAADVVKTVNYAREQELDFGVMGGSHGFDGLAMPRRGLLLDLSLMRAIEVLWPIPLFSVLVLRSLSGAGTPSGS